jgi:hypothetical protein
MKRLLLVLATAAAAIAVVLPATAGAATFTGAVVAKDAARKALVTASRDGTVRTVRLHAGFARLRVGSKVSVSAVKLPDGTFTGRVRLAGRARVAHVRASVVKRLSKQLVVSAGGSVFALRLTGKRPASDKTGLQPGDKVDCNVRFKGGSPETRAGGIKEVGHDGRLELEGIYLSTADDGTLELAVVHRGRVLVAVPDDVDVPDFQPGDEIALVVTVEDDGSFTLVKAANENEPGDGGDDGGVDIVKEHFSVVGEISAIGEDGLSVKVPEKPSPVRCTFDPETTDLSDFAVGEWVSMTCKYGDGRFVLVSLEHKDAPAPPPPGGDAQGFAAAGTIADLDEEQISLDVDGHEEPVACAVAPGADLSAFEVGDEVTMKCKLIDGDYTLKVLDSATAHYELNG